MADTNHLVGFALATPRGPEHLHRLPIADARQAAPEGRGDAAVVGVLDHLAQLAVLDAPTPFASELKLVARVVDRPRTVRFDVHAALDPADEVVECALARLDVEVRHAIDRRPVPAAGAR